MTKEIFQIIISYSYKNKEKQELNNLADKNILIIVIYTLVPIITLDLHWTPELWAEIRISHPFTHNLDSKMIFN